MRIFALTSRLHVEHKTSTSSVVAPSIRSWSRRRVAAVRLFPFSSIPFHASFERIEDVSIPSSPSKVNPRSISDAPVAAIVSIRGEIRVQWSWELNDDGRDENGSTSVLRALALRYVFYRNPRRRKRNQDPRQFPLEKQDPMRIGRGFG